MPRTMRTVLATFSALACYPACAFAFGAIAVDSPQPAAGQPVSVIVIGHKSRGEATAAALAKCAASGGKQCTVIATFERCGALAASPHTSGTGWGITGRDARNRALRACNNDDCRVILNACEDY